VLHEDAESLRLRSGLDAVLKENVLVAALPGGRLLKRRFLKVGRLVGNRLAAVRRPGIG
jgi:hypothetical protein